MSLDYFATQSGSYTAEVTRRALLSWAARTSANSPGIIAGGVLSASDLTVSAPASGMSVNIGAGEALIGGTEGGAQGGYYIRNSATYSASVAAANASLPRIDACVVTIADSGYTQPSDVGATTNGPVLAVVTGTPTASASLTNLLGAPAIPASSLLLAYLLVPAGASNIVTADIAANAKVVNPGNGLGFPSIAMPSRAANTAYQPNTLRPVLLTLTVTVTLATGALSGGATILCDASNPPTTERSRFYFASAAGDSAHGTAVALVPPGYYYKFGVLGTGSTIAFQEVVEYTL